MKKLILIRHAKSSWKHHVIDHERPLNDRGLEDAHLVSNHLVLKELNIDSVLCSDATRTKTTAGIFIANLGVNQDIVRYDYDLYDFLGENLLEKIKQCHKSINNLMVFGHNHAITHFVNTYGNKYIENVPTCGVVVIEFDIDSWLDLNKGNITQVLFPRDLK